MVQTPLTNPLTVQMRLPADVLDRLKGESERDMIPMALLVRRCLLKYYGGGDAFAPDDSWEFPVQAQIGSGAAERILEKLRNGRTTA